jgi:hypothetical protein
MKAQVPPSFCISAMTWSVSVVLPDDSGPVDLDHPAARQAADAEGDVEAERSGRDDLDVVDDLALAEPHDRALAVLLLDLRESGLQGLGFFGVEGFDGHVHGRSPEGAAIVREGWMFVQ